MRTIYCFIISILIFSLTFGIAWAVVRQDIQGGFAITGCTVAIGSLGVGCLAIREAEEP